MMVLVRFALLALFATTLAFPKVQEFEIVEDDIDEGFVGEEVAEEIKEENRLFDLISRIDAEPRRATKLTSFTYKDCGGPNSMVNINSLSITPDPLTFPGPLNVATEFKIKSPLNSPLKGDVLLYKEVVGKYIKIPCIDNIGSCTYEDLCVLLEQVQCPDPIVKIGIECMCPLKANSYNLPKTEFDLDVTTVPAGTYRAVGNATMGGSEGFCLDITLTLS